MQNQINYKQFILPFIILMIILAGVFYWKQNQQSDNDNLSVSKNKINEPIILGDDIDSNSNIDIDNKMPVNQKSLISDQQTYIKKVEEIRNSVNDIYEDIIEKYKYPNLFSKDEILKLIDQAEEKANNAKKEFGNLDIVAEYKTVNDKHIESVDLLLQAAGSLRKAYDTGEKKYLEEFQYKIDQSNKLLNEM